MPYPNNPNLQQMLMQIDQESAQKKANLMQSFYAQQNAQNTWSNPAPTPTPTVPTQNVNWIQVSGVDGAKNQIVQPGQTAWMMDNNAPYFYVKSVDNVGSCDFRIFQFSEVVADMVAEQQPTQPQIDLSQYVQRAEFDELKERLDQLTTTKKKQPAKANKGVEDNG